MSRDFMFRPELAPGPAAPSTSLKLGDAIVPIRFGRNRAARRYILRVRPDGTACVTIPPAGNLDGAIQFLKRHLAWLAQQVRKQAERPSRSRPWENGTEILFRGEKSRLTLQEDPDGLTVQFADQKVRLDSRQTDLRRAIEQHLWSLALLELPKRVIELAAEFQSPVRRISIRNQRSRWGSCSVRGTISLNWRLVQTPPLVRDYIILHELMHLREMNHSPRYWELVAQACPDFEVAELWLKQHSALLR